MPTKTIKPKCWNSFKHCFSLLAADYCYSSEAIHENKALRLDYDDVIGCLNLGYGRQTYPN